MWWERLGSRARKNSGDAGDGDDLGVSGLRVGWVTSKDGGQKGFLLASLP